MPGGSDVSRMNNLDKTQSSRIKHQGDNINTLIPEISDDIRYPNSRETIKGNLKLIRYVVFYYDDA